MNRWRPASVEALTHCSTPCPPRLFERRAPSPKGASASAWRPCDRPPPPGTRRRIAAPAQTPSLPLSHAPTRTLRCKVLTTHRVSPSVVVRPAVAGASPSSRAPARSSRGDRRVSSSRRRHPSPPLPPLASRHCRRSPPHHLNRPPPLPPPVRRQRRPQRPSCPSPQPPSARRQRHSRRSSCPPSPPLHLPRLA